MSTFVKEIGAHPNGCAPMRRVSADIADVLVGNLELLSHTRLDQVVAALALDRIHPGATPSGQRVSYLVYAVVAAFEPCYFDLAGHGLIHSLECLPRFYYNRVILSRHDTAPGH